MKQDSLLGRRRTQEWPSSVYNGLGQGYVAPHVRTLRSAFSRASLGRRKRTVPSLCAICSQGVSVPVRCQCCGAAAHPLCYGGSLLLNRGLSWICDKCLVCGLFKVKRTLIHCRICHREEGTVKWVHRFGWTHPDCVDFSPNLRFKDREKAEIVVFRRAEGLGICIYCDRMSQWVLKCEIKDCKCCFHWKCGQVAGLRPLIIQKAVYHYCPFHRDLIFSPQSTPFLPHFLRFPAGLQPVACFSQPLPIATTRKPAFLLFTPIEKEETTQNRPCSPNLLSCDLSSASSDCSLLL